MQILTPVLRVLTLFVAVLAAGCASLSPYSISEGEIERQLKSAVAKYDREQLQSGSPLSLSLNDADITLGPDGRDVAVIDLKGQVALNALRSEEHTSELQSRPHLVCRLLLEKKN